MNDNMIAPDRPKPANETPYTKPLSSFQGFCTWPMLVRYRHLKYLAETLARPESWDHPVPEIADRPEAFPVLGRYIDYTFRRLREQDRISVSADQKWASFNTGLVTERYREIFGLLDQARNTQHGPWHFIEFVTDADRRLNHFATLPERATYFDKPEHLVYDTSRRLILQDHALIDRVSRFPPHFQGDDPDTVERRHRAFETALKHAEFRVKQSYRAAIPQFYWPGNEPGRLQLLLPICLDTAARVDFALPVEIDGDYSYRGYTPLEMNWAYSNARLVAKPDSDWLRP
ncbi:hypothetical protein H4696_008040 [Amycolatopsis lexingtonensis]|uniref:DUF3825 domain-containing protein n=1 Tax=Amycolatopsis lexingtonensis TaxID=218822 RepID=A0ABR9ICM3_9PSEU|nr:DUF3825 domain-containing protein [Amycolatopsis lexingtonensis]MBE1500940.1 hypothetical protein [Amycolatopsis lexingtonensis]